MSYKTFPMSIAVFIMASFFVASVNAAAVGDNHNFEFEFTGNCLDCVLTEPMSETNPLDNNFFEEVTGTLSFRNVRFNEADNIELIEGSSLGFRYGGSALINGFTLVRSALSPFSSPLSVTGQVPLSEINFPFRLSSREFFIDDDAEFCTDTGIAVLGAAVCTGIGEVSFLLSNSGDFSISARRLRDSDFPLFDVGINGELTPINPVPLPAAAWLFGSALLGFVGFSRRKRKNIA